ncbi:MAG: ABC transporter ATP-binding protein, partial [Ignisphaera sp.]
MVEIDKAIEVRGLRVKYRSSNEWVLRGVDLDIYPNKTTLILGKSGSGKTTLVRALTGVAKNIYGADVNGVIKILGRDLSSYNSNEIRGVIQVVNQNPYADFMGLYINEDIDGVIRFNKVDPNYVDYVFKLFKVEGLLDRSLFELSGGQLKRLAIVKALMFNPAIVIFDEPLMWLDDFGVESVVESIKLLKILG